ncbi:S1 domain-containing post-transcriptional regulator GSP13 [Ornithinibacillus halotolerans]|uniref:General stress protein 13 n=1 Tax=Ornithinibacillus halotolerans TaxID=1274357 RepID=A0A916S170_9BACI|nr:S1 domain-containing post-transcriptional regulator GSP13 [Ornithinibacillus halotolerans]GGA76529.1 general stress protein 13 [Ornithinibacillus halotolerans]
MSDKIEVGQIINGKVTGIQPYGAFVALNEEVQGLVHISEVTHGFVKDINDHLSVGDEVSVKVLNIDEAKNKVSLSIRATEEAPKKQEKAPVKKQVKAKVEESNSGFNTLKDKLEEWIQQSEFKK